jgi:hypothetical protein
MHKRSVLLLGVFLGSHVPTAAQTPAPQIVPAQERVRNNCLILLKRRLTGRTLQLLTEMFKSPLRRRNPRVDGPRRIVTDVLLMAAFKFSYPVAVFI